jgi:hypothetical protein
MAVEDDLAGEADDAGEVTSDADRTVPERSERIEQRPPKRGTPTEGNACDSVSHIRLLPVPVGSTLLFAIGAASRRDRAIFFRCV